VQVLPELKETGEVWNRFPNARKRLINTIYKHNISAPIILSGDIHMAEVSLAHCSPNTGDSSEHSRKQLQPSQLLEVTSSGMTHAWYYAHTQLEWWVLRYVMKYGMVRLWICSTVPRREN
jgi:prolipoprotein diacylglyceryltransferase